MMLDAAGCHAALSDLEHREAAHAAAHAAAAADLDRREAARVAALADLDRKDEALIVDLRDLAVARSDELARSWAGVRAVLARKQTAVANACRPIRIVMDAGADAARIKAANDDLSRAVAALEAGTVAYCQALAAMQTRAADLAAKRAAVVEQAADIESDREALHKADRTAQAYFDIDRRAIGAASPWAR